MPIFLFSRMFEAHMQNYKGSDPLGEWERLAFSVFLSFKQATCCLENKYYPYFSSYMQWVEDNFPENKEYLTTLLERLMKEFLDKKKYHSDPRFINYCLKFVSILSGIIKSIIMLYFAFPPRF